MFCKLFCIIILFVLTGLQANAQINWETDYEKALKISKETGKPLLLDFTASWCGVCQRMERVFWVRPDVAEFSKQIVFVKLDADANASLKEKYQIVGLPNVVLTDSWGAKIDSHLGFGQNADRVIIEKLTNVPKDFNALKQAGDTLEKDANNTAALHEFAEFYQSKKLYSFSIPILQKILTLETEAEKRENTMLKLAFNHLKLGQITPALANFDKLLKEFPQSTQTDLFLHGIILAQINRQNFEEAEKQLAKLKTDFPQSVFLKESEIKLEKFKAMKKQ